jgi:hypothetical protein
VANWSKIKAAHREVIHLLLELYGNSPNDLEGAMEKWEALDKQHSWGIKAERNCLQLYNPQKGKGHNRVKTEFKNEKGMDGFWLEELLKVIGFFEVGFTRLIGDPKSRNKDRKTMVINPRSITFLENTQIMSNFADKVYGVSTSTKLDIIVVLRYTTTLLDYFADKEEYQLGRIKHTQVAGFQTAFYKNLGSAIATMNIAFIALPGWIDVNSNLDMTTYQAMLSELDKLTRQFDESHSDAFRLLQFLRDFVSGDDLDAFFRFTNAFPAYYMGMQQKGKKPYNLSVRFVERLMMSTTPDYTEIVQNPGFREIAYAIRQSTIIAQRRTQDAKQRGGKYPYEIRYGLVHALRRRARDASGFIADLSEFLQNYSAETAQVEESMKKQQVKFPFRYQRRNIKVSDIEEIVYLISKFQSAETIANLLIAYGYANDSDREDQTNAQEEASS